MIIAKKYDKALSSPLYNFFQILPEPGILVVDSRTPKASNDRPPHIS